MQKLLWFLVSVLTTTLAFAQGDPPLGASDFVKGQRAVIRRSPDDAIKAFEAALDRNPDLILSHYYLGYAYGALGNWAQAGEHFVTFLDNVDRKNPTATPLVFHATREAGLALARGTTPKRAIPFLEESLAAKPDDVDARFYLGVAYMKSDNPQLADIQFTKTLELDAQRADAHYYRGVIAFARGENVDARERLETFLDLAPRSSFAADAHYLLASVAIESSHEGTDSTVLRARARTHLETFLEIRPKSPRAARAHFLLGTLAFADGDRESANDHLEKAIELEPEGEQAEQARALLSKP